MPPPHPHPWRQDEQPIERSRSRHRTAPWLTARRRARSADPGWGPGRRSRYGTGSCSPSRSQRYGW